MRTFITIFFTLLLLNPLLGIDKNKNLTPSSKNKVTEHQYYTLSYNESSEQADWVAYTLSDDMVNGTAVRKNSFKVDNSISTGSATNDDYKGSGYDRGHLCPAADMKFNQTAMNQTFLYSNMSPQHPSLNRGRWKSLEALVRTWVKSESELYVVAGGVFSDNLGKIGPNEVIVPGYYYKIIYDSKDKNKMIAFLMPNKKCTGDLKSYIVSVDKIEELTGIDFFPQLEDSLENRLESSNSSSSWSF